MCSVLASEAVALRTSKKKETTQYIRRWDRNLEKTTCKVSGVSVDLRTYDFYSEKERKAVERS